ncbi:GH92 family glycosyl hydrolase [Hymenobacter psoromatis]|uniref:GH92 family glycosyl hydrolase n=1 Tax=Hymenobacter psoromatis TaxID=1484116 RepID=UPI001CBC45B9|nr:GH92 family glycosyl hydrolase [Hymenobacter psoromatis]
MKHLLLTLPLLPLLAAAQFQAPTPAENLVQYAHPLVGTAKMGHTYPGATVPFGSIQLSPDTDTISYEQNGKYNPEVYSYCAGYRYQDPTIVGFSHTHFSGTGHSDLGDFLVMPTTGPLQLNPGTADKPRSGYRSVYSHATEVAEPAYYKVRLADHDILAELTATTRVGIHQYTFPKAEESHVILDMMAGIYNYPDKNVWTFVRVENDSLVTGYRQTNGWGRTRTVYFALSFSRPFKTYGSRNYDKKEVYHGFWGRFDQQHNWPDLAAHQLRLHFDFGPTTAGEQVKLKMAISPVSTAGALANLRAEAPGWKFADYRQKGQAQWQQELRKIVIQSPRRVDKENFYTAMYHAFIGTTIYQDVDGQFRGLDQNNHLAKDFTNYTTFSLWDTYRALHPLYNLVQPQRNADMVQSMLTHFDLSAEHMLPVWVHYANENWCMIGYHAVPVLCDAIVLGNAPFDQNHALDACVTTARQRWYDGLGDYIDKGYVPEDKSGASVSKTLEYAFDDYCIAQAAQKLGRKDIEQEFRQRATNWQHVYDARIGFMRPRLSSGQFRDKFDVLTTSDPAYIEGNAWNYSLYVPQDPAGLIAKMGGSKNFVPHLDSLFTMNLPDRFFAETEDITREGIIGNYVHGNEPAHHVAYLYNWTDQPWKAQPRIRMILNKMYHQGADGLGGNDDCGQMSAWYIFSALGFYPVAPASGEYALGSPAVYGATLQVGQGKTFTVTVKNQSDKNVYVQSARLNGQLLTRPFLPVQAVRQGGTLEFVMGGKPARK